MKRYGLTEFELEQEGFKIRLRRDGEVISDGKHTAPPFVVETPLGLGTGTPGAAIIPLAVAPMAVPANSTPPFPPAAAPSSAPVSPLAPVTVVADETGVQIIKSPMVGTFYRSPNP